MNQVHNICTLRKFCPNSRTYACVTENSNGINLVAFAAVLTEAINLVPGLLDAPPCGWIIKFSNLEQPLKYLFTSVLPSNLGDSSPAVKFVKA